ncbi:MAG: PAS domain S-box protein [Leptolyngbyaceae cyanobacterium bins.302]|nr:PAS domain S-box protein [Leptolyngbyaceae cyanobacterium bins.302]
MWNNSDRAEQITNAEMHALFAGMNDLVLIRDSEGRCQKILTPQVQSLLYRTPEELLGRTLHETLPSPVADLLLAGIRSALQTRHTVKREYCLEIDDRVVWLDARLSPMNHDLVLLVIRDISDRKQLELQLWETQAKFQDILNSADAAIISFQLCPDYQIEYLYYSTGCEALYGYSQVELMANSSLWRSRVHPEDWQQVLLPAFPMLMTQSRLKIEYRFHHANDSWRWVAETATARWDEQKQCWIVVTVARDVTGHKTAEMRLREANADLNQRVQKQIQDLQTSQVALRQREQELQALLTNIPDVIARFDQNLRYLYANAAIETATGLQPQYFVGKQIAEVDIPSAFAELLQSKLQQVIATADTTSIYFHYPTPQGERYFEAKLVPELGDQGVASVLSISRDITALKETEAALRRSEEQFRRLFEASPVAIGIARASDKQMVQVNPAYTRVLGYSEQELLSMRFTDFSHPDDMPADLTQLTQLAAGVMSSFQMEKRYIHKNGDPIWTNITVTILRNQEVDYSLAIIEDITERKHAEEALRRSEEKFRTFFDCAPLPLSLVDIQTHRFLRVNAAYQTWLGYSYEELYTKTFLDITHPDDLEKDRYFNQQMQAGSLVELKLQKRFIKKSGEVAWANITVALICDEDDRPLYSLCLTQDITQSKQLTAARDQAEQALLKQSQRDQLLRVITQHIHQSLNLSEILAISVAEVRDILDADRVLIFQLHPDGSGVVLEESVVDDYPITTRSNWKNLSLSSKCYASYKKGLPRIVLDIAQDECSLRPMAYLQSVGTRTKMTAPILQIGDQGITLWGLLIVHACAYQREWQADEADLLQQIANQLGIAIQQATLYQQVQADLGQRQETESKLRSLLQEKEILLKEVHHRVKNNLQVISSLLRMQSRQVDTNARQLFQETQNRVQSIAIIHEHLYQSADLSHINFGEYVQILVNQLFRSYGVNPEKVKTKLEIQPLNLGLNHAIACGLIINELVSNSLKYAFCSEKSGEINICLILNQSTSPAQNQGILMVGDNGSGIPAELNWQNSRSLGLRIVRTLVEQINGTISLDRGSGTAFYVTFPIDQS